MGERRCEGMGRRKLLQVLLLTGVSSKIFFFEARKHQDFNCFLSISPSFNSQFASILCGKSLCVRGLFFSPSYFPLNLVLDVGIFFEKLVSLPSP